MEGQDDLQMDVWVKTEQEEVIGHPLDIDDTNTQYVDMCVKEEQEDMVYEDNDSEEPQQTLPLGGKRSHSTESILEADSPSEDSKELSWVDTEPVNKKIKLDEVDSSVDDTAVIVKEDDDHCLTDDGRCVEHRCNNCCDNFDSASDLVDHLKQCFARIPSKCSLCGVTCLNATALSKHYGRCLTLLHIGRQLDANAGKSLPQLNVLQVLIVVTSTSEVNMGKILQTTI